ncbi:hypothetical protein RRG08_044304 [Elysia crispata]|uniref:Uncharacterized protein n=1 Tax=Elysia crispata TaxID=231223 RepID=A0AAE1CNS6_9GAST|nr:hypothetical protein RRG08_044304 [Elysia crispata]
MIVWVSFRDWLPKSRRCIVYRTWVGTLKPEACQDLMPVSCCPDVPMSSTQSWSSRFGKRQELSLLARLSSSLRLESRTQHGAHWLTFVTSSPKFWRNVTGMDGRCFLDLFPSLGKTPGVHSHWLEAADSDRSSYQWRVLRFVSATVLEGQPGQIPLVTVISPCPRLSDVSPLICVSHSSGSERKGTVTLCEETQPGVTLSCRPETQKIKGDLDLTRSSHL